MVSISFSRNFWLALGLGVTFFRCVRTEAAAQYPVLVPLDGMSERTQAIPFDRLEPVDRETEDALRFLALRCMRIRTTRYPEDPVSFLPLIRHRTAFPSARLA